MPDPNGKLYFGDLSQQCNWPLNVAPPVMPRSPPPGLPPVPPTAGHVARGLARAEPSPRPALSEPMLHTLVSQSINRHNLRIFDPNVPPPPRMNAHLAAVSAAGQPSHRKESADRLGSQKRQKRRSYQVRILEIHPVNFLVSKQHKERNSLNQQQLQPLKSVHRTAVMN